MNKNFSSAYVNSTVLHPMTTCFTEKSLEASLFPDFGTATTFLFSHLVTLLGEEVWSDWGENVRRFEKVIWEEDLRRRGEKEMWEGDVRRRCEKEMWEGDVRRRLTVVHSPVWHLSIHWCLPHFRIFSHDCLQVGVSWVHGNWWARKWGRSRG